MLVDNSVYRNSYVANGSTTKFAISFPFLDNAHIIVYKNVNGTESVVNSSEYTITGAGQQNGGTLTFGSAPSSGTIIVIARNVPITQLHKYTELDNFPAESHEDALAKLTMIDQQQQDSINRAIKLAETDTRTPDELLNEIFTAKDVAVACATESCQCADNADTSRTDALQFRNEAQSILNNTISEGNKAVVNVQAQEASSIQAVKGQEITSVAVVEAEGDTQVLRLVDMANNILISGTAYNKEVTADITVETPAETYITLPVDSKGDQLMYRVGAAMIRMSYNGAQMYVGDQFDEVGIAGSISTLIKVNFTLEVGSRINFFIISQNVTVIVDESSGLSVDENNRLTAKPLKAIADAAVKTVNGNAPDNAGNITPEQTGCLPLTGGAMTGNIKFNEETAILFRNDKTGRIVIRGGVNVYEAGASVYIHGAEHTEYAGQFRIMAHDGTNNYTLVGKPDGTLEWGSNDFAWMGMRSKSSNAVNISVTSNGTIYTAPKNGYINFTVKTTASTGAWAQIYDTTSGMISHSNGNGLAGSLKLWLPVAKGDVIKFQYGEISRVSEASFTPCNASV